MLLCKRIVYSTGSENIHKNAGKIIFSVMCLVMMFVPMIGAAADNDTITLGYFIKPENAKQELEDSAFKTPVDKGSNWLTIAIIGVIVLYNARMLYKFKTGDDDERASAFKGMFFGLVMVVAFLACTSTSLDALTWDY